MLHSVTLGHLHVRDLKNYLALNCLLEVLCQKEALTLCICIVALLDWIEILDVLAGVCKERAK